MKEQQGLRYNEGKTRYDLLEPFAIEQLARVFTKGAEKYADHNWLKGLKWMGVVSSLKRHLAAFEKGEDYDAESGELHMAHVAWNAMALISHYRYHPELDDRLQPYMVTSKRIGVDIDECLANFTQAYSDKTGSAPEPIHWSYCDNIVKNFEHWSETGELNSFYASIKPLVDNPCLGFEPVGYITNRPVSSEVTREWLIANGFPQAPVFTTTSSDHKVKTAIEQKLDIFIDDNFETFVKMNKAGVCCFLMDAPHNRKYEVGYKRIKDFNDFKTRFL